MNIEAIIESKDNLEGAHLRAAYLEGADLSGATGLLSANQWMADNFETAEDGYVVYKAIGKTHYETPTHWEIRANNYLAECRQAVRQYSGCEIDASI